MKEKMYDRMLNDKVKPLLIKLCIPSIISTLITSIYNIADTFFVSTIDTSATAAISVAFSLQSLIQAAGFTLGMGAGSSTSMLLGKKEKDKADIVVSSTMALGCIIGLIILTIGLLFTRPIMYLLGSTDTAIDYAVDYGKFVFIACPVMMLSFIMNNVLRSEGHSNLSMVGLGLGGILNIGLDPLFIMVFHLGVKGAGLATVISQLISFFILLSMYLFHKSEIRIGFHKISKDYKLYLNVVKLGSPTLFRQGCASISNIILNNLAHPYGDACIAALGIVNKVYHFVRSMVIGIGQGYQPILGYNFGAKKSKRIKEAFGFALFLDTIICFIATALVLVFPTQIISFFRDDEEVIRIGKTAIRLLAISLPFLGYSTIVNQSLQVTGFSKSASFLASLRQGIIFIPLVFLMAYTLKDFGLCLTQPLSDFITALISTPFLFFFLKKLKENEAIEE